MDDTTISRGAIEISGGRGCGKRVEFISNSMAVCCGALAINLEWTTG